MSVERLAVAPAGCRRVPLLDEPALDHYPEFAAFLSGSFELAADPFGPPPVVAIDGRAYELVFIGRSGRVFPCGVEVSALVEGLEPLDEARADSDLSTLVAWLLEQVGPPWSAAGFEQTARIFRIDVPGD